MIWLEEFAPGQRYVSPRGRVDAAAIKAFAAEFDPQPFHLHEDSLMALTGTPCIANFARV
jgi:acyl dehydratase